MEGSSALQQEHVGKNAIESLESRRDVFPGGTVGFAELRILVHGRTQFFLLSALLSHQRRVLQPGFHTVVGLATVLDTKQLILRAAEIFTVAFRSEEHTSE